MRDLHACTWIHFISFVAPKKRKLYLRDPLYSITRQIWIGNKGPSQLHSSQHDVSNTFQENDNVTGNDNDDSSLSNSSSSDDDLSLNEEDVISDVSSANCSCIDDNLNSSLDEDDTDDGDASQKSNEFSICSSAATAVSSNLGMCIRTFVDLLHTFVFMYRWSFVSWSTYHLQRKLEIDLQILSL